MKAEQVPLPEMEPPSALAARLSDLGIVCRWRRFGGGVAWCSALSGPATWWIHTASELCDRWGFPGAAATPRASDDAFGFPSSISVSKSVSFDCKGNFNSADLSSGFWAWLSFLQEPWLKCRGPRGVSPSVPHLNASPKPPCPGTLVPCATGAQNCRKGTAAAETNPQHLVLWWWRVFYLGLPMESCTHKGLRDWGDKPQQLE